MGNERRGGAVLHLRIEERYADRCPVNGDWFENSKGIFGERYLEIGPPPDGAAWERAVADGDSIRGIDPPRLDRLAAMSVRNLTTWKMLTADLAPEWRALTAALDETDRILADIQPGPGQLLSSYSSGSALVEEAKATAAFWGDTGTSTDARAATIDQIRRFAPSIIEPMLPVASSTNTTSPSAANPRSIRTTLPLASSMMLPGFTSRWMTFCSSR